MANKPKIKFVMPAKMMNLNFIYNGKMDADSRYMDNRPEGKVHIKLDRMRLSRCGLRGLGETWTTKVRSEDICKSCLKDWLHNSFRQVELEL